MPDIAAWQISVMSLGGIALGMTLVSIIISHNPGIHMDESQARRILRSYILGGDDALAGRALGPGDNGWIQWQPSSKDICLEGSFTLEELRAIEWWVRNAPRAPEKKSPLRRLLDVIA